MTAENEPACHETWRELTRLFATWRLILISGVTARSLLPVSNSNLPIMLKAGHWQAGLKHLAPLASRELAYLEEFATINARLVEHVFRATAMILVTIPVGIVVAVNEITPEVLEGFGIDFAMSIVLILTFWLMIAGAMLAASWRAKDLLDLIVYERARRTLNAEDAG